MQFLDTALELVGYTMRHAVRFPARYRYLLAGEIVRLSQQVLNHAKAANSIYPTCKADAEKRRGHLIEANCALQGLISQLDVAQALLPDVPDKVWLNWLALINQEAKLLASVRKADAERYKNLV